MCGHLGKQTRKTRSIVPEDFVHQFNGEFSKIDFKQAPLLNIYNNGSFLNDREIPPAARAEILKKINKDPHIKMVVIESRPEFITEENVKEVKELLSNKHVEIAVGLELKNDLYRNLCLNKGFSTKTYSHAASIITRYVHLRSYVFLKPPFLTEGESIDEAVETIEYAFDQGNTTVSLEACTIQDYTLVKYLNEYGVYTTPWMWSIVEVVKRASAPGNKKLIVGLFQFYPSPCAIPYNCPRCSEKVMDAIRQYNSTLDAAVFDGLSCHCQQEWRNILTKKSEPFEKRLGTTISQLRNEIGV
jgi:radical SAM enzyme (TIGR01210 family)